MLITRKTQIPTHWVFYAQVPFVMWIASTIIAGAPFLYALKKFIGNPAAITFLLSLEVFVTALGTPFTNWLSDRIWTRFGRRKIFVVIGSLPQALSLALIPFAPNLVWLLVLRWSFGVFSDLAAPNQALTMEVVPPKQRGMGSGFFQVQLNLLNIVFWYLVFGRLDDIAFTGPLSGLTSASGETLVFLSGAILLFASSFYTFFGIHEVKPAHRTRLNDGRHPGENIARFFIRSFVRDILSTSLLPLYLLLLIQVLAGIDLGVLAPLLYTEQWGYSKQDMGTNVAIGAVFGILLALGAGWIADRAPKLQVYTFCLVVILLSRCAWTLYVYDKPDFRPTLFEILVFSNLQFIFVTLATVTSLPLILDYVSRNQLGTASAGMGLFSSVVRNGFNMLVGFYLLVWSLLFLPQAGEKAELVFNRPVSEQSMIETFRAAGVDTDALHFKPILGETSKGPTSRHWEVRRSQPQAADAHAALRDLNNQIETLTLKIHSPLVPEPEADAIKRKRDALDARRDALRAELQGSAEEFETQLKRVFAGALATPGRQIADAAVSPDGRIVQLSLRIVEPLRDPVSKAPLVDLAHLKDALDSIDIARQSDRPSALLDPALQVTLPHGPENRLAIRLERDREFVALEDAFARANIDLGAAFPVVSDLIHPIRDSFGPEPQGYRIEEAEVNRSDASLRLEFTLLVDPKSQPPLEPHQLRPLFIHSPSVQSVATSGQPPEYFLSFTLEPLPDSTTAQGAVSERLKDLLPDASAERIKSVLHLYHRIEAALLSPPQPLHTAQPVLETESLDRQYDYFFSMQFFMIVTDILGICVALIIMRMEKRGKIRRLGAEEDLVREAP